jgi:hypothetical protein
VSAAQTALEAARIAADLLLALVPAAEAAKFGPLASLDDPGDEPTNPGAE